MPNFIAMDPTIRAAQGGLDGLSMRQQVIGRNLANIDTPGYHAQSYQFEEVMRAAFEKEQNQFRLTTTNAMHISFTSRQEAPVAEVVSRQGGSFRADGNNVDIDVELTQMSETGIAYQALTQAASKKLALLKSIASAR